MSAEPRLLRFGVFELDRASGELRRAGKKVRLAQQPFKVLSLLADRAGEVVTRDELRTHVWGDDTYVDFERGLNFCVLQIRRALDDDARVPRFVETLPRRGYRLIGPVEVLGDAVPATLADDALEDDSTADLDASAPSVPKRGAMGSFAVVFMILVAIFIAQRNKSPSAPVAAPSERVMLGVLPFKNLSGDPGQEYWSDGLTEEMIAQLGGLDPQRLGVIARTTMERYKETTQDVGTIGRELGVDYLLEGSVRRDDEAVRITAQLIEVGDQTHVWAESYERNKWGALVVQRDVGRAVSFALRLELLPEDRGLPDRAGSHRPEAHDAYLMGRYLERRRTREDLERGVEYFARASELDPQFALPRAALAETYHQLVMTGTPPHDAYPQAREAAWAALEIDPGLAEAHLAAARVSFWYDWAWSEAERHLDRALELNPSSADALHEMGWFLIAMGRPGEGLARIEEARALDPFSPVVNVDFGWALIQARRFAEAEEQCRRTLEIEPGLAEAEHCMAWARLYLQRDEESLERVRRRLEALLDEDDASPHTIAVHFALLGENESALEWLEKAYESRQPSMALMAANPAFDALRDKLRFRELLERLAL